MSAFQFSSDFILDRHLSFVGFGRISQALCKGMLSSGVKLDNIFVSDTDLSKAIEAKELGLNFSSSNADAAKFAEIIFLCVKPDKALSVLREISPFLGKNHILVSVAAGISLQQLNSVVSCKTVRLMPNLGVSCNKGVIAFAFGSGFSSKDKKIVLGILEGIGLCLEAKENEFDLITAVSGCGPAFWAFLISETVKAAELNGLSKTKSRKLVLASLNGTLGILMREGISEEQLIELVSSPGGVTEKELDVLRNSFLKKVFSDALKAGIKKSGGIDSEK
ncbi:MAG: pyrroline-5-carboxylate reductase [archaeon]